jgi:hypothetical protein
VLTTSPLLNFTTMQNRYTLINITLINKKKKTSTRTAYAILTSETENTRSFGRSPAKFKIKFCAKSLYRFLVLQLILFLLFFQINSGFQLARNFYPPYKQQKHQSSTSFSAKLCFVSPSFVFFGGYTLYYFVGFQNETAKIECSAQKKNISLCKFNSAIK